MAKSGPTTNTSTPSPPSAGESKDAENKPPRKQDSTRETLESIIVAFILAFLFRTFEAEAFVIPTGSMAPTLYGRHIDVECQKCGLTFAVGASSELDDLFQKYVVESKRVRAAYCPNCRHRNDVFNPDKNPDDPGLPVFKGDRILVNKFPYELSEPDRWDVVVFKYPENPSTNYIKRLVGLPGEKLEIRRGDVYVQRDELGAFSILRKDDPWKQLILQQLVYDDNYPAADLLKLGWPERWSPMEAAADPDQGELVWLSARNGWQQSQSERSYSLDATTDAPRLAWLRYQHLVPDLETWRKAEEGVAPPPNVKPQLISDFCSYNAYTESPFRDELDDMFWVGDLTIQMDIAVRGVGDEAQLVLELNEGVRRYQCRFNLKTGEATLAHLEHLLDRENAVETVLATVPTPLQGVGDHHVVFANVDDRLCLWIDKKLIDLGKQGEYAPSQLPHPQLADLAPVGIGVAQASVQVSNLLLQRDIYYRAQYERSGRGGEIEEFTGGNGDYLRDQLSDPHQWAELYEMHHTVAEFDRLADDEYFMMGDNSPRSLDSRLWKNVRGAERSFAVPRTALIGKAFFIYWPHGIPFLNDGRGYAIDIPPINRFFYHANPNGELTDPRYPKFTIPFYPNIGRMHRIR